MERSERADNRQLLFTCHTLDLKQQLVILNVQSMEQTYYDFQVYVVLGTTFITNNKHYFV